MSDELVFTAQVQKIHRIAIPRTVYEALDIKPGDYVEVRVKKLSIKTKGYPLTR
ncbi:MAG: AbrB/MazE/SpoVT family DNA-binding domain-containing protein [Candidatus Bathyarchaeia archaeon]